MPHGPRELLILSGNAAVADFWPYVWNGSSLYKWSNNPPNSAFTAGFTKTGGHDDLIRHVKTDQGRGSNFLSCSTNRDATSNYGDFLYEISLLHSHTKAFSVNDLIRDITKHRNPFAEQEEIAIYKQILPKEVSAVWIKNDNPPDVRARALTQGQLLFSEEYNRVTRESFLTKL